MANVETIDAVSVLSNWYGVDSIACTTVRRVSAREATAEFAVGQNLCGPLARPPMFDRLMVVADEIFTTDTAMEDARQHFIESVGISVVPGHKITNLAAEALRQTRYPNDQEGAIYIVGFDFMRLNTFLLPGQTINFNGKIERDQNGATGTFTMYEQRRPFTRNFRIEIGESLDQETKEKALAQHWIVEANFQGLGVFGLASAKEGVVPVLVECGQSTFTKVPVLAGQTLRSHLDILSTDERQILGNSKTYIGDTLIAQQQDLLLALVPINTVRERIEQAKQRGTN